MTTKRIIITGASSGIGRAIAQRLADDGDQVALLGRDEQRLAEAAAASHATASATADVTDRPGLQAALDDLRQALGGVDVLITCAGGVSPVDTTTPVAAADATFRATLDQNLVGTFNSVMATAPHLPRPGGRVVTFSSIAAAVGGSAGGMAYASAKAGVEGLTRALANELGPEGIAVNAIAPGYIADTRFFGTDDQTERQEHFASVIPSGRAGAPEDVASLVAFLCADASDHIRGQTLHLNGGQHLAG